MRYLLDTNVVSELVKRRPTASVRRWIAAQSPLDLAISVISLGEIEKGIARLPASQRRAALSRWARTELPTQFIGRLLGIDAAVALAWGVMAARATADGRPLPVLDGLLLATVQAHGLTFVTRNVSDCARRGSPAVPVYDPWTDVLHA